MAAEPPATMYSGRNGSPFPGNGVRTNPTFQKTKSIAYGTSDQIYSASVTAAIDSPSGAMPQLIELTNNGGVPLNILVGYETFSNETTDSGATMHLHIMLMPGETYYPNVRGLIHTTAGTAQFIGTALDNQAPDANEYTDSGANVDTVTASDNVSGSLTNTTVYLEYWSDPGGGIPAASCDANKFRVNDLIRIDDEIMKVTGIGTRVSLQTNTLTVERGMYGSSAATGAADGEPVRLPFFNAYHDFDKYSVAQTDSNGKFKCFNFFGQGRASTGVQGIVPGSVAIKFYEAGYRSLGLSGITSSTNTSLTASGSYWFKIAIDGGTAESINFTVDSSNTNWGGTNGVLQKINTALTDKYNNTASNTFQQKSSVAIVNGDVRFTSGQRLSTSAIALTAGTDGASASYNIFAQQNGHFPALANVPNAVDAKLPDDVVYDRITYATSPNTGVFGYDDGRGRLFGMCNGTINYETGAIDMTGCPVNAEFVYTVAHSSGYSGKLNTGANAIVEILANTASQKWNGSVVVKTY